MINADDGDDDNNNNNNDDGQLALSDQICEMSDCLYSVVQMCDFIYLHTMTARG